MARLAPVELIPGALMPGNAYDSLRSVTPGLFKYKLLSELSTVSRLLPLTVLPLEL